MESTAPVSDFGEVLIFLIGGITFIILALTVSRMLRPNRPNDEKLATYESGEEPVSAAWTQFNVRFYIIALIFILFEVEIVLLFPWATVFADPRLMEQTQGAWGIFAVVEALLFIIILGLGLAYAWNKGFLTWVKPSPKATPHDSPVAPELYQAINERYKQKVKGS